ncbi:DUF6518 family protein [Cryobacterium sp. SO2]|uniref:DUF6518 family protein n=1 Tax=Cryobacterium sp. SO2 TaxID=1897060 RepID=UPI00223D02EA|nr:DUF6518 family protein [Cryobacterium sp. SO2]WEO75700.1 DUF6518 family protein [Cryobacterium sp. SO2]
METLESSRAGAPPRPATGWWVETWSSVLRAGVVAVVGAVLIGGLTSVAQQYLPSWVNSLSNSAGGWTMFSFLIVWLGRARPLLAGVLGIVVFQLLVESYSVVSEWRGFDDGDPLSSVWTVVGLVAGPLLGVAAGLVRHGSPRWRALAVTPLAAVLLGEGVWALSTIVDSTSPVYWALEVLLSAGFIAAALVRTRATWPLRLLVVGVWLAGTVAFLLVWIVVLG